METNQNLWIESGEMNTLQVCADFVTAGSKTSNVANKLYFDELVDTGIEQELTEPLAIFVMLAMMRIPEHDRSGWESWSCANAPSYSS